ncbi:MAG: conserved membrane protein of unknown function [Promethearchaeota archaeon]|nr:MAG: conserved membrane protein of unknown function [Candidatus Lokiarchaeota archaeon]
MASVTISDLEVKDFFHGISAIIIIIVSVIIGIRILYTYYKYKDKINITVGLTYFFLLSPYWGGAISFIGVLIANYALDIPVYLFLSSAFLPIALVSWIYSVATLIYKKYKKMMVIIYIAISIIFEILLIVFLLTDYTIIGEKTTEINIISNDFLLIFQIITIVSMEATGIHFSIISIKSADPKVNLKGKFLLAAWLLILVSVLLDAVLTTDALLMLVIRILLVSGVVFYYLGFFLPEAVSERILK